MAYVKTEWKDFPSEDTPITASALNNIENGIEANDIAIKFGWYQTGLNPTLTYSSWDSTTKTGVVNTNLDLTGYLSVGMKVKFTQNATTKYGIITAISSSTITLFMGTDYTLTNDPISDAYYSIVRAPYGFPMEPDKWTIIITDVTNRSQNTPVYNTWYNIGGLNILVPVGSWKLSYRVQTEHERATAGYPSVYCALSTSANSISNFLYQSQGFFFSANICSLILQHEFVVNLTTPTTFYLIAKTDQNNCTKLSFRGDLTRTIMKAVCNYL